jgi:hypothetical protein
MLSPFFQGIFAVKHSWWERKTHHVNSLPCNESLNSETKRNVVCLFIESNIKMSSQKMKRGNQGTVGLSHLSLINCLWLLSHLWFSSLNLSSSFCWCCFHDWRDSRPRKERRDHHYHDSLTLILWVFSNFVSSILFSTQQHLDIPDVMLSENVVEWVRQTHERGGWVRRTSTSSNGIREWRWTSCGDQDHWVYKLWETSREKKTLLTLFRRDSRSRVTERSSYFTLIFSLSSLSLPIHPNHTAGHFKPGL